MNSVGRLEMNRWRDKIVVPVRLDRKSADADRGDYAFRSPSGRVVSVRDTWSVPAYKKYFKFLGLFVEPAVAGSEAGVQVYGLFS